jgi:hypothetical protein
MAFQVSFNHLVIKLLDSVCGNSSCGASDLGTQLNQISKIQSFKALL